MASQLTGLPEPPFKPDREYKGLPVPYSIHWPDGADKPDFTTLDPVRHAECASRNLCGVCGKKIKGNYYVWIGGFHEPFPTDAWFLDAPMHPRCARYSARVCPYLLHGTVREGIAAEHPERMEDTGQAAMYFAEGVVRNGVHSKPKKLLRVEKIVKA